MNNKPILYTALALTGLALTGCGTSTQHVSNMYGVPAERTLVQAQTDVATAREARKARVASRPNPAELTATVGDWNAYSHVADNAVLVAQKLPTGAAIEDALGLPDGIDLTVTNDGEVWEGTTGTPGAHAALFDYFTGINGQPALHTFDARNGTLRVASLNDERTLPNTDVTEWYGNGYPTPQVDYGKASMKAGEEATFERTHKRLPAEVARDALGGTPALPYGPAITAGGRVVHFLVNGALSSPKDAGFDAQTVAPGVYAVQDIPNVDDNGDHAVAYTRRALGNVGSAVSLGRFDDTTDEGTINTLVTATGDYQGRWNANGQLEFDTVVGEENWLPKIWAIKAPSDSSSSGRSPSSGGGPTSGGGAGGGF